MDYSTFVRKPFTVEAVEVTPENIEELSQYIGTLSKKENGTPFIQVDKRRIPNVFRVYPGYWMTKMGENIRCYTKRIFEDQFVAITPEISEWVDFMNVEDDALNSETVDVISEVEPSQESEVELPQSSEIVAPGSLAELQQNSGVILETD